MGISAGACRASVARARDWRQLGAFAAAPRLPQSQVADFEIHAHGAALRIRVWVKPRAAKSRILGVRDGALELALAAPPVDGAANKELIRTLAHALGCAKSAIEVVSGGRSRSKLVAIAGFTDAELVAKLCHCLA